MGILRSTTSSLRQARTSPFIRPFSSTPAIMVKEGDAIPNIDLFEDSPGDKVKSAGKVFVVSVNDAFVMKAWSKDLDSSKVSGIRFLADPAGEFTRAWDVEFDATPLLGNKRSKRYAVVT